MTTTLQIDGQTASRVGLGGCPLGGHGWGKVDDQNSIRAIHSALDLGVNFFDTADVYGLGHSEEVLCTALGERRRDVLIASKFGVRRTAEGTTIKDISPSYLRQALEASLRRLQLECLPLYYIHWPDRNTPVEDAVGELERCRCEGKIKAIGVSNFSSEQLLKVAQVAKIDAVQIQYSLVDRQEAEELLQVSKQLGIPLVTWGSLAQGLLTGKYDANSKFGESDRRSRYDNFRGQKLASNLKLVEQLQLIAGRIGRTPGQVAMRWLLDTPGVGAVLFGAKTPEQVRENAAVAEGWKLEPSDYKTLRDFLAGADASLEHSHQSTPSQPTSMCA
ncbi:aldo/keto reductase [Adhaeretor mobilis]|uniref:General stress protein 69 n=1 Tax=Adhaeretor mobilis TaxID=1930276 RepID=A0A517MY40_9BACT|nr:aldo/keto reductase [Adhaeretor mobilis]QDS99800.1 General stress protein 69 [Adhaeretor mobilis]